MLKAFNIKKHNITRYSVRKLASALCMALYWIFVPNTTIPVATPRRELVLRLWQSRALQKVK